MTTAHENAAATFTVLDAFDGPHDGRILRLRLTGGSAPALKTLRGAELHAEAPDGDSRRVRVVGFPVFGGKPSDDRVRRSGRVDLHVTEVDEGPPVGLRWTVRIA